MVPRHFRSRAVGEAEKGRRARVREGVCGQLTGLVGRRRGSVDAGPPISGGSGRRVLGAERWEPGAALRAGGLGGGLA